VEWWGFNEDAFAIFRWIFEGFCVEFKFAFKFNLNLESHPKGIKKYSSVEPMWCLLGDFKYSIKLAPHRPILEYSLVLFKTEIRTYGPFSNFKPPPRGVSRKVFWGGWEFGMRFQIF